MLANIRQFESLQENFGHSDVSSDLSVFNPEFYQVENAPLQPITPVTPVTDGTSMPQWKKTVDERLGNLERNLGNVQRDLGNVQRTMATKADFNELKSELKEIKTLIQQQRSQ